MGHMTLATPHLEEHVIAWLATINKYTKFEVSSFTHARDAKGGPNVTK